MSNNFLFNTNHPFPKINQKNFAVNGRCYDVTNKNTLYPKNMINNSSYQITQQSFNMDTAMGMSAYH